MARHRLDFVIQNMPRSIDWFSNQEPRERLAVWRHACLESPEDPVLGLDAIENLGEPMREKIFRRLCRERDLDSVQRANFLPILDHLVQERFGRRAEEIVEILPHHAEAQIRRMLEDFVTTQVNFAPAAGGTILTVSRRQEVAFMSEGEPAPNFTLPDQAGKPVELAKLRGKPVVLYFYPKDDTPTCTKEACAFRDTRPALKRAGAEVIGVSPDPSASHKKFATKFKLPYKLLADTERTVCEAFGVWKEKTLYGRTFMGVERTTFVIDADGIIARIFPRVRVDGHAQVVLDTVKQLRKR